MNPATSCPTLEVLFAFAAEDPSLPETERLTLHLRECPSCRCRLDALARHAHPPAAAEGLGDSECSAAIAYLAVLPPPAVSPPPASAHRAVPETAEGPPAQLREYRLLEKIGTGGMGAVYRAVHTRLDKVVAVKLLPSATRADPETVARFQREMKAIGKLDHPNIVRATDAGEVDGTHFLVMEFIEGPNLAELVSRGGRLAVGNACELIRQAATALDHAHTHGLIHRDIKPSNLLVTPSGTVKVLDLGLALLPQ